MNIHSWFIIAKNYLIARKVIGTIVAIVVLYGCYYTYGVFTAPSTATRYVTTTVATGTVVASITETGQVSASSNIDIQSKSSGEVFSIPVTAGQHVVAGAALAYLDTTTAQQNVVSAERALQSAQIALATSEQNLSQSHESGYNDVSAAFLNLPTVMTGLDTVLHGYTVPGHLYQQNINSYSSIAGSSVEASRIATESAYQIAYTSFTKALADFKSTPRTADDATIGALINEAYQAVANLSDALKASTNFFDSVTTTLANTTVPSTLAGHVSTLTDYTTTTRGYETTLSSDAANVASTGRTFAELQAGVDPLAIQSSKLSLLEKQDALAQAQQALADTVVRAPFSGTVGKLGVQQYQTIGNGTAVATLVSDNQSVVISVNEVDAAKLKVGEKATITFDALPNISIAGTVSSVNTIGIVTSGVVSYGAVITFDTPNQSVKPGMSATVDIIIGTETGLVVPSSAVKGTTGQNYVEIFNPPLSGSETNTGVTSAVAPSRTSVVIGLSDDTSVIIENGLSAGAQVVTRTVTGTSATVAKSSAAASTSLFGGVGGGARSGGGAVRALTQ